jgi:HTH-type transcriptional regulator / antitoxin MqsA
MHECLYCKGELEEKLVTRVQEYHSRWYLIENLPARVCLQCGATFYSPDAHSLVMKLVREGSHPARVEHMDVMDASKVS